MLKRSTKKKEDKFKMKLSEQIKDSQTYSKIAADCVSLMEDQVNQKKGLGGMLFKTLYKGINAIGSDYAYNAIVNLIPAVSRAIDPLWEDGVNAGDPVDYLKQNQSLTADTILSVTDIKIKNASNKVVKVSYEKIRGSLKEEIETAVPRLAEILQKNATVS